MHLVYLINHDMAVWFKMVDAGMIFDGDLQVIGHAPHSCPIDLLKEACLDEGQWLACIDLH